MKKFAKMSLVAALAVAGVTSANAKDLAEAIKGVDVSGTIVYRYDDRSSDDKTLDRTVNRYKVGMSLKAPVNDDVTVNTRFLVTNDAATGDFTTLNTKDDADSNVDVRLSQVNFAYTGIANTTLIVGKQGLGTPWTNAVDSDGSEQTGTGILGVSKFGPVTAVAGYMNQTNISAGENLVTAGLLASFAGVNVEGWYLDISDNLDSYYFGANTSFKVADAVTIGLDGKYTTMDDDTTDNDDLGNFEVGVTAKMGIFNAGIAYAESDEDGDAILNSVAKNGQIGYSVNLNGTTDAEMWMFDLGAQVTPELHVGLNYDEVEDQDGGNADDHEETFVQVTYKMSKNLMTYVRIADGEDNGEDYSRGRLQVQYSF